MISNCCGASPLGEIEIGICSQCQEHCEFESEEIDGIDIAALAQSDVGKWVIYKGNAGEIEEGRIKSWNDEFVFVVYKCGGEWDRFKDFTGCATRPGQLEFKGEQS